MIYFLNSLQSALEFSLNGMKNVSILLAGKVCIKQTVKIIKLIQMFKNVKGSKECYVTPGNLTFDGKGPQSSNSNCQRSLLLHSNSKEEGEILLI